jgi:hypothetical protein
VSRPGRFVNRGGFGGHRRERSADDPFGVDVECVGERLDAFDAHAGAALPAVDGAALNADELARRLLGEAEVDACVGDPDAASAVHRQLPNSHTLRHVSHRTSRDT